MANVLLQASQWLSSQLRQNAGEQVTYAQGATTIPIADAVRGRTDVETVDDEGVSIESKITDWLIQAAELVSGGVFLEPAEGDLISVVNLQGKTEIFEAMSIGGEKCYRPSDPFGNTLRIHTRLTAVQ